MLEGDSTIISIISAYDQSKDLDALRMALAPLVRSPKLKPRTIAIPHRVKSNEEASSPLDTFLQDQKKGRDSGPKLSMNNPILVITEMREEVEGPEAGEEGSNLRVD